MSWWNPVDDVKSAAKDVGHIASDVAKTGENLVHDAYSTARTAVKGVVKVGGDLVKTGEKAGGDILSGHFGKAFKDTGTGLLHTGEDAVKTQLDVTGSIFKGAYDLGRNALKVGGDLNHLAIDTLSAVNPVLGDGLRVGEVFTESAVNTAILQPVDGLEQLAGAGIHALTGYKLPKLELHITPDTKGLGIVGKIAEYAGDGAGYIAPLILTGGATSAIAGLALAGKAGEVAEVAGAAGETAGVLGDAADGASVATDAADTAGGASKLSSGAQRFLDSKYKVAADGAISGFLFTPSHGSGNILAQRFEAAGVNAATFGAMGAASHGLLTATDGLLTSTLGDAASNTAVRTGQRLIVGGASGVVGGATNAETSSILSGKGLASGRDVADSALKFAATGAALDGANILRESASSGRGTSSGDSSIPSGSEPSVVPSTVWSEQTFSGKPVNAPESAPVPTSTQWSEPTLSGQPVTESALVPVSTQWSEPTLSGQPTTEAAIVPASTQWSERTLSGRPSNIPTSTEFSEPTLSGSPSSAPAELPASTESIQQKPVDTSNGRSDVPSYENLVSDLRSKGLTPSSIASSIRGDNLLGEGYSNRVYSIDGLDGYVARISRLTEPERSANAPLEPVSDYWKEANLGQPVAQLGDIQILKKVDGDAIKGLEKPSLLDRVKGMIGRETPAQRYERQERIIAAMPQSAYDGLAEKLIGLQQRGKFFDAVNPGNVLVAQDSFNPVDIGDEPVKLQSGAIDGRSAGVGLYEMLRPLTGTGVNDWAPNASQTLQESYQKIIEKSVAAAQKAGVAIVPDPRLQQLFHAAGVPNWYNSLIGDRATDPNLQEILKRANYYGSN